LAQRQPASANGRYHEVHMATKSKKATAVSGTKFVAKKQWPDGVRALVTKALSKSGSTAEQVAATVSKTKKGYAPATALNCLRWLATQGYVARVESK
jgi:fructoselysine-6-P-deglycase FrlB-like protein